MFSAAGGAMDNMKAKAKQSALDSLWENAIPSWMKVPFMCCTWDCTLCFIPLCCGCCLPDGVPEKIEKVKNM